ncbi:MAG: hypothetical protein M1817_006587 [Caeruleum heppii]|nr:MAG: hypothetical protein M1817_006587 [Caeruleum heppii]
MSHIFNPSPLSSSSSSSSPSISPSIAQALINETLFRSDVVIVARPDITSQDTRGKKDKYEEIICDTRIREDVLKAVGDVVGRWGGVDVVVSGGPSFPMHDPFPRLGAIEDHPTALFASTFSQTFTSILNILQCTVEHMRKRGGGRYVFLTDGSVGAGLGWPGGGARHATKYAIEGLLESFAHEVVGFGVRVTMVETGPNPPPTTTTTTQPLSTPSPDIPIPPSTPYIDPTNPANHAGNSVRYLSSRKTPLIDPEKCAGVLWQVCRACLTFFTLDFAEAGGRYG